MEEILGRHHWLADAQRRKIHVPAPEATRRNFGGVPSDNGLGPDPQFPGWLLGKACVKCAFSKSHTLLLAPTVST